MGLKATLNASRIGCIVECACGSVEGSLNDCVNAWLRGSLDDMKKVGWVNGRMGNENVNVWREKGAVRYSA